MASDKNGKVSEKVKGNDKIKPEDKLKALETALTQIKKQFGEGAVMRLGQNNTLQVESIPTGSLSLDLALGIGGLPRGRIVEIYGPESSGKTCLLYTSGEQHRLPALCILFYMGGVIAPLLEQGAVCVTEKLPRFLGGTPVYQLPDAPVCFLDGGRGAPQAADTLETLYALGVRQVLTAGMCGAFSEQAEVGDRILPDKAFIEEGTSLHYAEPRLFSTPSGTFLEKVRRWFPEGKCLPVVSTDAVFRQTYEKEALWRRRGAVGVDMETSALFTVAEYLGVEIAAVLTVSDKHPEAPGGKSWHWGMTAQMRRGFAEHCAALMREISMEK